MEEKYTQGQAMKNFFEIMLDEQIRNSSKEDFFNENIVQFINATLRKNPRYETSEAELQINKKENGNNEYKIVVDNLLEMSIDYEEFFNESNTPEKFEKCFDFFYGINRSILRAYKESNFDNFVPTTKEDEITSYFNYAKEKLLNNENRILIDSSDEATLLTLAQTAKTIKALQTKGLKAQKEEIRDRILRKAKTIAETNINLDEKDLEAEPENIELIIDDSGKPESIKINRLDELIASNPKLLNEYKVFRNGYNSDGSPKELDEAEELREILSIANNKNTKLTEENKNMIQNQIDLALDIISIKSIIEKGSIDNLSEARKLMGDDAIIDLIDRGIERRNHTIELSNEELNPSIKYFNDNIETVTFELSDNATSDLVDLMDIIEKRRNDERLKQVQDIGNMELRILEKLRQEFKEQPEKQQPVSEEEKKEIKAERDKRRKGLLEKIKENFKNRQKEKEEREEPDEPNEPEEPDEEPYSVAEPIEEEEEREVRKKSKKEKSKTSKGARGKDGEDGENGSNGRDGEDGRDGTDGENGRDRENGRDGKDGTSPEKDDETNKKIEETNKEIDNLKDKIDELANTIDNMNSKPNLDTSILIGIEQLKSLYKQILEKNDNEEISRLQNMIEDLNNKIEEMKNKEVPSEDEPIIPAENIEEPVVETTEVEKEEDEPLNIETPVEQEPEISIPEEDEPIIPEENVEEPVVETTEVEKEEDEPLNIEMPVEQEPEISIPEEDEPIIPEENVEEPVVETTEVVKEEDEPLNIETPVEQEPEVSIPEEDEPIIPEENVEEPEVETTEVEKEEDEPVIQEANSVPSQEENKTSVNVEIEELRKSKDSLINGIRQKNEEEIKEYENSLQQRADEIIDKLDPSKVSLDELYKAREHLDARIAQDVAAKRQQKEESLKMIQETMEKYITRKELTDKLNELNKVKEELKTKQELIESIENETVKSLKAVEDEIESVKDEIKKNDVTKEDGQIGTI